MKPTELRTQLADWDKRQAQHNRKVLVKLAQLAAEAETLSDKELANLDTAIRTAGATHQQFLEMVATITGYKGRPLVTAEDEAKANDKLQAAKIELASIMAEREMLPHIGRNGQEQEARERWFQRRDDARFRVMEAEAEIKRLEMTKTEAATVEHRHAQLVGSGAE